MKIIENSIQNFGKIYTNQAHYKKHFVSLMFTFCKAFSFGIKRFFRKSEFLHKIFLQKIIATFLKSIL